MKIKEESPKGISGNIQTQEDKSWCQKENNSKVPTEIIRAQQILKLKLWFEISGTGYRFSYLKK